MIIPVILRLLRTWTGSATLADGTVAQYSAAAICLGALVIGLSVNVGGMVAGEQAVLPRRSSLTRTGWALYSTGSGVRMAILSIATSWVATPQLARLNTVVIAVETFASLTISPLIWQAWSAGLKYGDWRLGLPFFVVTIAFAVISAGIVPLIWLGSLPRKPQTNTPH